MKLIFVNRFYWPEIPATGQLLTDLAEGLVARGWEVTVITSAANSESPNNEVHRGVRILRVTGSRRARHGTFGKALDFGTFYLGALWRVLRIARSATTVVPMTDPPLLALGVWMAARCRRARIVHWIQDIYPEIAIELFGQRWLRALCPLRNLAWRAADGCVTLGTDMVAALHRAGVRPECITIVPNWAPAGIIPTSLSFETHQGCRVAGVADPGPRSATSVTSEPEIQKRMDVGVIPLKPNSADTLRQEWKLTGKFVVAYSGNLGRVHDLEPVIALAAALRNDPEIAVILVGDGAQRRALEAAAHDLALPNLAFHPPQSREQLGESLAAGDLHLVTLRRGCEGLVFPSKLYGITAAGRPILFIGPLECEVAHCVIDHQLGRAFSRDDVAGIAAAVRHFARDSSVVGNHATAALRFAARHTAAIAVERWHTLLLAIAGSPPETKPS